MQKHSLTALAAACGILPLMLAPLSDAKPLYYGVLILLPIVRLWKARSISGLLSICLCTAGIGILLSNPLPVFRPWERLMMFALLLAGIGPLFGGNENEHLSRRIFSYLTLFCLIIGALSAVCGVVGINYGAGVFSGLTPHSMVLGPIAGIGMLYALHGITKLYLSRSKASWGLIMSGIACAAAMLQSASRSAILAAAVSSIYLLIRIPRGRGILLVIMVLGFLTLLPFAEILTDGLLSKMKSAQETGSIFSSRAELWGDRWEEFINNPLFGVGFASQSIITYSHSTQTGIIEPGSSYLGSLSMLGLAGSIPLFLTITYALYRGIMLPGTPPLSACILIFFCVHMAFEGYLLSAGSILCILLWSCISAIPTTNRPYQYV